MQDFKKRMEEIRGRQSRSAFALAIGVSEGAVRTYEKGAVPSLDVAVRMANYGNVSLDWLTGRDGSHKHIYLESTIELDENVIKTIDLAGELIEKIATKSKRILISPTDLSKTFVELLHFVIEEDSNEETIDNIVEFQIKKRDKK